MSVFDERFAQKTHLQHGFSFQVVDCRDVLLPKNTLATLKVRKKAKSATTVCYTVEKAAQKVDFGMQI